MDRGAPKESPEAAWRKRVLETELSAHPMHSEGRSQAVTSQQAAAQLWGWQEAALPWQTWCLILASSKCAPDVLIAMLFMPL